MFKREWGFKLGASFDDYSEIYFCIVEAGLERNLPIKKIVSREFTLALNCKYFQSHCEYHYKVKKEGKDQEECGNRIKYYEKISQKTLIEDEWNCDALTITVPKGISNKQYGLAVQEIFSDNLFYDERAVIWTGKSFTSSPIHISMRATKIILNFSSRDMENDGIMCNRKFFVEIKFLKIPSQNGLVLELTSNFIKGIIKILTKQPLHVSIQEFLKQLEQDTHLVSIEPFEENLQQGEEIQKKIEGLQLLREDQRQHIQNQQIISTIKIKKNSDFDFRHNEIDRQHTIILEKQVADFINTIKCRDDIEPFSPIEDSSYIKEQQTEIKTVENDLIKELENYQETQMGLMEKIKNQQIAISDYKKTIEALQEKIKKLIQLNQCLQKELSKVREELTETSITERLDKYIKDFLSINQSLTNLDETIKQELHFKQLFSTANHEISQLNGQLVQLQQIKEQDNKYHNELIEKLITTNEDSYTQMQQYLARINKLKEQLALHGEREENSESSENENNSERDNSSNQEDEKGDESEKQKSCDNEEQQKTNDNEDKEKVPDQNTTKEKQKKRQTIWNPNFKR